MTEDSRISEIRAVLDGHDSGGFLDKITGFDLIRAILDRPAPVPTCGVWGGCPQPVGHNRGRADVPENHGPNTEGTNP